MTGPDELELLRALLRASDYGVLLSGADRRDLLCNRRFCDFFGLDAETTVCSAPHQVRAQVLPRLKFPEEFVSALDAVYADPHLTREDEVELVLPVPRLLRRYTAPVVDNHGAPIGRLWTFWDITRTRGLERKVQAQSAQLKVQARQLAAALKTTRGRLHKVENTLSLTQQQLFESEKLSAVGLLAASVAHDIRNILTPLNIEIQLADQDDTVLRQEALRVMRAQVDRLSVMTHRLLALARPAPLQRAPLDLIPLAQRVLALLAPQVKTDGVDVHLSAPRALPRVAGDSVQIEQVLINLVLNGAQAMHAQGGRLSVTLALSASPRPPGVCIRIRDQGPGIAPRERRHLFEPFWTTRPDGAGLGLFSCRRIVEAHGGAIGIRSGRSGTQVTVWLPAECACPEGEIAPNGR